MRLALRELRRIICAGNHEIMVAFHDISTEIAAHGLALCELGLSYSDVITHHHELMRDRAIAFWILDSGF